MVEDSRTDIFLIREAMERGGVGADVDVVRDGQAATRYLDEIDANEQAPRPDLVLLDLNLPKKSGDQVLQHLRESVRCKDAKVLIVSSSDALPDRTAAESFAVDGYFKKPTSYAAFMRLSDLVMELLEPGRRGCPSG